LRSDLPLLFRIVSFKLDAIWADDHHRPTLNHVANLHGRLGAREAIGQDRLRSADSLDAE
jgi:hypothetical protein